MALHIGKEVVCVKAHPKNKLLIVGKTYIIQDIKACNCELSFNVGLPNTEGEVGVKCWNCGQNISVTGMYFSQSRFADLSTFHSQEVEALINERVKI